MKLTGNQWFVEHSKVAKYKINDAIIKNNSREIVIDYEDANRQAQVKLTSDDGVHFKGEYKTTRKVIGRCEFNMYKNRDGFFLIGEYSSIGEGSGIWWMELKPQ